MSFYFTNEEIRNLVSYFVTTTEWLCYNNCDNKYEKREKYCLIHDISKRFLNCYQSWMTNLKEKPFIQRLFKNLLIENHNDLPYFLEIFKNAKDKCHYRRFFYFSAW